MNTKPSAAAGVDTHPGSAERLKQYWEHGEGAAKIGWGTAGDFDRCVLLVTEHTDMTPEQAKGYCNERHHGATGMWPSQHAKELKGGAMPTTVPQLVTIPDIDLVATGTWDLSSGRQTFTTADLHEAVKAMACPAIGQPVIKLGHIDPRFDGEPAIGKIANIRVNDAGTKLKGDLAGMPGWLAQISASAFPRRSVEGCYDFKCQIGHTHPFVLTGVALLGVAAPGVGVLNDLSDIASLYGVSAEVAAAAIGWEFSSDQLTEGTIMAVTEEDVRRAYYATGGDPSLWITELQMDPTQLIVTDGEKIFRVPFAIAGTAVTFEGAAELSGYAELTAARGASPVVAYATAQVSRSAIFGADNKPYGDVKYADPGYKTDGKKRYPLDSEGHVRSAWSYINMPKNQKGYTATQVSSIKGRIKSAASKFGIEISEGKSETGISRLDQVKRADGTMGLIAVMTDGARIPVPAQRALGAGEGWSPNNSDDNPADPHDVKYEVGPMGLVNPGPVPANIVGSGNQFAADQPSFVQPSPEDDPHDESFDKEEQLSMDHHDDPYDFGPYPAGAKITPAHGDFAGEGGGDPHDTPYDLGGQVGKVPGDRPGGRAPQGQLPDNIVAGTGRGPGAGSGASPGTAPAVGTEPVVAPSGQAYDWSGGSLEPGDPQQELDAALRAMDAAVRAIDAIEAGCDPHDAPTLGGAGSSFHTGSWEPTNIEGGTLNKGAGEDGDSGERVELDLGMAEALERTIIHCYKLAEGNAEVRQTLAVARKQFHALLRSKPQQKKGNAPAVPNEIQQKMDELRSEVGNPDTGNVAELIKYMRTEGTAPLGYRGLLDHDPDLHMTTAAERLAQEVLAKRERARVAASEYDKAEERVKAAQREAQLNDAIRRNNLNKAGR